MPLDLGNVAEKERPLSVCGSFAVDEEQEKCSINQSRPL